MRPVPRHPENLDYAQLSAAQVAMLVASARALRQAALSGQRQTPLRGRNLGLLCDDDTAGAAQLFRRAATELGARVAHIRPSLTLSSSAAELHDTARVLARLYDAVECQGLPGALVERLAAEADLPVFDGIALAHHPTAVLAEQLGEGSDAERRCWMLQAALAAAVG